MQQTAPQESLRASWPIYLGLFLCALGTLTYELVLTRIFSVTVWYHFAFLAVSLGMFGMTAGALIVQLCPELFPQERTENRMSLAMVGFALSAVLSILFHLAVPIILKRSFLLTAVGLFAVAGNCLALAVPFMFSGVAVCLALTRFPKQVGKLYASDLIGAALGCLFVIYELNHTSGPSVLLLSALIGAFSALCFSTRSGIATANRVRSVSLAVIIGVGLCAAMNMAVERSGEEAPFRLMWIKGHPTARALYERWNSFSMIRVGGNPFRPLFPQGWGLDPRYVVPPYAGQLYLDIDANAVTYITQFNGDLRPVRYLQFDVTNIVHYLRSAARVLVIGVGGGRDILSSLVFHQKSVTGVELNPNILHALNDVLGAFSGHLNQRPDVHMVNAEARSYISGAKQQFDIIQISLIDTWAATSSGAFALAENAIYTVEAWRTLVDHLSDKGILSVSRWYDVNNPAEIYRLVSLASSALRADNIADPRDHLLLIRYMATADGNRGPANVGVGTLLICKAPFTADEIATIAKKATELNFKVMLSPVSSLDPQLTAVAVQPFSTELQNHYRFRIDPPTDDVPYFLQLMKPSAITALVFNPAEWGLLEQESNTLQGFLVVVGLSVILTVMLIGCIFIPLVVRGPKLRLDRATRSFVAYFVSIGLGYMFLELSQMQRLSVYLGHPTYGLSVVLFTLLLSSGLGSFCSSWVSRLPVFKSPAYLLAAIALVLCLIGLVSPPVLHLYEASSLYFRIAVCVGLLSVSGFCAGMALPTGMALASVDHDDMTAWFWALNGAASVLGAVIAVLSSITIGITFTYGIAFIFYVLAAVSTALLPSKALSQS
jgi:predicted membrane-bound spermidine synthase